jgi:4-amino-4-deoxychorismate lyase
MNMHRSMVNGQVTDRVRCDDRGLSYGDGLFETMAVVAGNIPLWQSHMQRLQRGCERLQLACPDVNVLREEVAQLVQGAERAVIKLLLTRGSGGRGYAPVTSGIPTRVLQVHPWPELSRAYWETGVKVIFCEQRLARQPALAGIKHLNRLEQVLARGEWTDPGIQEGLVADSDGHIIEAVSHNVFLLKGKTWLTPELQYSGVAGVMREHILSLLRDKGYAAQIRTISRQEVLAADAVFLCNSLHGIWFVNWTVNTMPAIL